MTFDAYQIWNEGARVAAVARAKRWTEAQARRLNTTPAVILTAIREGGWLPEQIECVESLYALEGIPPELTGVESWVDARIAYQEKAKAQAANDQTALTVALKQAKAAA